VHRNFRRIFNPCSPYLDPDQRSRPVFFFPSSLFSLTPFPPFPRLTSLRLDFFVIPRGLERVITGSDLPFQLSFLYFWSALPSSDLVPTGHSPHPAWAVFGSLKMCFDSLSGPPRATAWLGNNPRTVLQFIALLYPSLFG